MGEDVERNICIFGGLSNLYEQEAAKTTEVDVKFVGEYCKKLTQKNLF